MNQAQTICLSRDWVVVVARGDSAALSHLNTTMRRIDLGCAIVAPMVFGMVRLQFDHYNSTAAFYCSHS
jgi:iron-regulated transporter 1